MNATRSGAGGFGMGMEAGFEARLSEIFETLYVVRLTYSERNGVEVGEGGRASYIAVEHMLHLPSLPVLSS